MVFVRGGRRVGGGGEISLFILDLTLGPRCLKNNQKKEPKNAQKSICARFRRSEGPAQRFSSGARPRPRPRGPQSPPGPPTRPRLERLNLSSARKLTNQKPLSEIPHKHREFFIPRRNFNPLTKGYETPPHGNAFFRLKSK